MKAARDRKIAGMSAESGGAWKGGFQFVQMADTQVGLAPQVSNAQWLKRAAAWLSCGKYRAPIMDYDGAPGEAAFRGEVEHIERCVECVNRMEPAPAFVCVCGDLVNAYPSQGAAQEREFAAFEGAVAAIREDIPLVCVCGNHDIGDRPNAATIDLFRRRLGDDYFAFWAGGCKFLVLNSQLYKDASDCSDLAAAQDAWLDEQLARPEGEPRARHTVAFCHIPPFLYDYDEDSAYFNLEEGVRKDLIERLARGGVSTVFCGHFHENAGGVAAVGGRELEVVVTGAVGANILRRKDATRAELTGLGPMETLTLSDEASGFRIVTVAEQGVSHEWCSIAEAERRRARKTRRQA